MTDLTEQKLQNNNNKQTNNNKKHHTNSYIKKTGLVSWCFKPSQPQRITSGLKTNFGLSPSYSWNKF